MLVEWADKNSLTIQIVELTISESESMNLLATGDIGAYVTLDSMAFEQRVMPICKIGSSNYYFTINKNRAFTFGYDYVFNNISVVVTIDFRIVGTTF